jgi:serine/threonine protein kinase
MFGGQGNLTASGLHHLRPVAEAVVGLQHPNIMQVYDFGEQGGALYAATELLEGGTLASRLADTAQTVEQTAALVETLARTVHYAHQQGVVHGHLSPARVLFGSDGTPKIAGFGLALLLPDLPAARDAAGYGAPEVRTGSGNALQPSVDIYSLGAMLYELLAGRPPSAAGPTDSFLVSLHQWRPAVPHGLESICLKCLKVEPEQRYPNAAALAEELRRFRSGEILFVDDLDHWGQQQRWARRAGYEIMELLGREADGFTYKALHVTLDRVVVLKRISAALRFVPAAKARFRWEPHVLAKLRHPNVVQVYDQGEQNDLSYFAREFVDGRSLVEKAAEGPVSARVAAEWVMALAGAVQLALEDGAVFGGLHPGNIRLTVGGVPKITSARRVRPPAAGSDRVDSGEGPGHFVAYLAPEQLEGRVRSLGPATDVYALGGILYTLLTGKSPFPGPTVPELLEQVRSQPPSLATSTAPRLQEICLNCLEKQPSRRPADAGRLANALGRFLGR